MKEKINDIKNRVYEAEGLLELLWLRTEKLRELRPLIKTRLKEALSRLEELEAANAAENPGETEYAGEPEDMGEPEYADVSEYTAEPEYADNSAAADGIPRHKEKNAPAFCLNDRFRFRRALFSGSDAEFSAAMDALSGFDNYDEAENYFIEEYGLDRNNEDVADFLQIIKQYFGA
ncbi:MAG: hypothetical protein NC204_00745 [Candidatus Amulumruptor caecigallinarius]|nr:hypothetical protein [Candidatus Amulumruptor caecigallinarius]